MDGNQYNGGEHQYGGDPGTDSDSLGLAPAQGDRAKADVDHQQYDLGRQPVLNKGILGDEHAQCDGADQQDSVDHMGDDSDPALVQARRLGDHPQPTHEKQTEAENDGTNVDGFDGVVHYG